MKPEEKAEIILWDWLKTKGLNVQKIYFNRKNLLGCPIFKVLGIQEKPDFIIKINDGFKIKYYAIEVKSSKKSKNILQSSKILDRYIQNYIDNKTKYLIEEEIIDISGFLIATDKSKEGFLFKREFIIDNCIKEDGLSKYNAATKYKIIPKKEGSRTFEFVRFLWEEYNKFRNNNIIRLDLGIIIGDICEDLVPKMFITTYSLNKNRWTQR
jgi:HrpA-like RNA helicase